MRAPPQPTDDRKEPTALGPQGAARSGRGRGYLRFSAFLLATVLMVLAAREAVAFGGNAPGDNAPGDNAPGDNAPADSAVGGRAPIKALLIEPNREAHVIALMAPWQDGALISDDLRWDGAAIERFRVCYAFTQMAATDAAASGAAAQPATIRVCLVAPDAAAALTSPNDAQRGGLHRPPALPHRTLPGGAAALLVSAPTPAAMTVLALVTARVQANQTATPVLALWTHAKGAAAPADPVVQAPDPLLWLPVLLVWLLVLSTRALRTLPGGGWPWALGLLTLSAALRFTLPINAPMSAWSFSRQTRLGDVLVNSTLVGRLIAAVGPAYLDDLQSIAMRVVATLTPLAVLVHSRKLFADARPALAAGLLLACSPHHLRFAAADTQFIPSMLWSSMTFVAMYEALEARHLASRAVHLVVFGLLLSLALTARPLSLAYAPLLIIALVLAAQGTSRAWRLCVGATIVLVTAITTTRLLGTDSDTIGQIVSVNSLWSAVGRLFRPQYNPLTYFALTPPVWLLLMLIGGGALLFARFPGLSARLARRRGLWLAGWLMGFVALHGLVWVTEPMNNARYQLHSLPAMAMLAGGGLFVFWRRAALRTGRAGSLRGLVFASVLLVVAAPALHSNPIRDRGFVTMQERALLQRWRDELPAGCVVLETTHPQTSLHTPRLAHVGQRLRGVRQVDLPWQVTVVGESLTTKQSALLANPPPCVVFYEGVECAIGPGKSGRQPICDAILRAGQWALLDSQVFRARLYDEGLIFHLRANGDPVSLRLHRLESPDP